MQNLTIITLNQPNISDFAQARNEALTQVKTPWVLFLDTDETISPALKQEITLAIQTDQFAAYYIPRRDTFLDRELKHGETGHTKLIRLARTNFGTWVR
ncbi:MAG: glycosyl transferase family 2, partial [uncultured bacterium]